MSVSRSIMGTPFLKPGNLVWSNIIRTDPRPQQRPRFSARCNRVYDPCASYKAEVLAAVQKTLPAVPLGGDNAGYYLRATFSFCRPKSHCTSKGALKSKSPLLHTQTPDLDNLMKLYLDAINKYVYKDDSAIVAFEAQKVWLPPGPTVGSVALELYDIPMPTREIPPKRGAKRAAVEEPSPKKAKVAAVTNSPDITALPPKKRGRKQPKKKADATSGGVVRNVKLEDVGPVVLLD